MARKMPKIKIDSYGRYSKWERGSKDLPKIVEFTDTIKAEEGNEFGMILHITGGKGVRLEYCIKHPAFKDKSGAIEPDFTGEYFVHTNDYKFYIGDNIWLPLEDKIGFWHVSVKFEGKVIAEKKYKIIS